MEITQLKYFKAVANTGKIITAANDLFVTPPAISTSIGQLEKELGIQLFTRKANRLVLNKQGEVFLEYVDIILDSINAAYSDIQESLSDSPQHISIAVTASNLWIDLIAAFSQEYPHYVITTANMPPSDLLTGTLSSRYAFILAADGDLIPRCVDECDSFHLFDDAPVIMVHPDHPLANRKSVSISEVNQQRLIWSRTNSKLAEKMYRLFRSSNVPIPKLCTYSFLICHSLVSQNAAVLLTTKHAQNSCTDDVRFIPIQAKGALWPQRLYWKRDRQLTDAEAAFRDFVVEYYQ